MKKLISLLLALTMLAGLLSVASMAAETPTEEPAAPAADGVTDAPQLTGFQISTDSAKCGDTVDFTLEASGADWAGVYFYCPEAGNYPGEEYTSWVVASDGYWADVDTYYTDGKLHGSWTIDLDDISGVYTLTAIKLYKDNECVREYDSTDLPECAANTTLTLEVPDLPVFDYSSIVPTSVTFSANPVMDGDTVTATVTATIPQDVLTLTNGDLALFLELFPSNQYFPDPCFVLDLDPNSVTQSTSGIATVRFTGSRGIWMDEPDVYQVGEISIIYALYDDATGTTFYGNPKYSYGENCDAPLPEACACSLTITDMVAAAGWRSTNGAWYYDLADGTYYADTTAEIGGKTYAFRADGTMISGWGQAGEDWYYCNTSGVVQKTGWTKIGGVWYYLDKETGVMAADEWVDGYYLTSSGAMATGWVQTDDGWLLFSSAGKQLKNWQKSGGAWYYLDPDTGIMVTDAWIGGYYVTPSGTMATGWLQTDDGWMLFSSAGKQLFGWQKVGSSWYYLDPETGIMVTDEWVGSYYVTSSGAMATGWAQDKDGNWMLFNSAGKQLTGWQKVGNNWYFVYLETGFMATDKWIDTYYYVTSSGAMATGWMQTDCGWILFSSSGHQLFGWQKVGGSWYYLDPETGYMYAGGQYEIDGFGWPYVFDDDGVWIGYGGIG